MTSVTHLRPILDQDDSGPQVTFTVQSWRRIVRTMLTDPQLATLPCRRDLLLVAYDFSSLCDVGGQGPYSSKERTGSALSDRPDPSLCELTEITKTQTSKMLKLLIALGCMELIREASMGRQAVYRAIVPTGSPESIGACLAVAAQLGFKPKRPRDMSRQNAARRTRQARQQALAVLADTPETPVDNPVDIPAQGVIQTTPPGGHANDPCEGHANDPQAGRTDDPPLPIGVLGNRRATGSTSGTGPRTADPAAPKDEIPEQAETTDKQPATVDGNPSGNRWGAAVSQADIRRTGRERLHEERAGAERCQGLTDTGCPYARPISPSNDKGLCIRCHGDLESSDPVAAPSDSPLSFDAPTMPPPSYGTEDGDHHS